MIYFTSDIHLYHKNIINYQPDSRPYTDVDHMGEHITEIWNSIIKERDEIYILGDVSMGSKIKTIEAIRNLKGRKHLIRGNHDNFKPSIINPLFETIQDYKILRYEGNRLVLFHFPIEEWDRCQYGDIHLHGHCHGNLKRILPNRFDIGWDVFERPISIDEVLSWKVTDTVPHHDSHQN